MITASRTIAGLCSASLLLLVALTSGPGQGRAEAVVASPWIDLPNARVRLLASPPVAGTAAGAWSAGVEVVLAGGWKTYWRMPGDAGVPPVFDWDGSHNVRTIRVLYPAPMRMAEAGAQTIGYKDHVLFPIELLAEDGTRPVELSLALDFGVCRDICIPAQARLSLVLDPAAAAGPLRPEIQNALERVPRTAELRRASDPELKGVTANLDGGAPRLIIEAQFPKSTGADLFVEADQGDYVPLPKQIAVAGDGSLRFEVDLTRATAQALKGKTLKLTLVSAGGASEFGWRAP